jgi:RNA polymerase sigma-70 factor, ECF subfamily
VSAPSFVPVRGAEEVAQEVFLGVYQRMPQFQRQASLHAWLFGIARKRCLQERWNYRRRVQLLDVHRDTVTASVHTSGAIPTEERAMSEDELERLRSSLGKLRKWERELLTKYFLQGYTFDPQAEVPADFHAAVMAKARALSLPRKWQRERVRELTDDVAQAQARCAGVSIGSRTPV